MNESNLRILIKKILESDVPFSSYLAAELKKGEPETPKETSKEREDREAREAREEEELKDALKALDPYKGVFDPTRNPNI